MSIKLDVGDFIITDGYSGVTVEICVFEGVTGFLMMMLSNPEKMILRYHQERYVKKFDSLPYSSRIVRKDNPEYKDYCEI